MTMLRYAETKKPTHERGKMLRFEGFQLERDRVLAASDNDIDRLAGLMAQHLAKKIKQRRNLILREIGQGIAVLT